MSQSLPQFSLSGGELAPALFGMVDLAFYRNCLKTQRNYVTKPYGGIVSRPGLKLVAQTKAGFRARLVAFSFSTSQNYLCEFGIGYIRIFANDQMLTVGTPAAWLTATAYTIGQLVTQAGNVYYCLVDHTSGTFATDLAADFWLPQADGVIEPPTDYTEDELRELNFTQSADVLTVLHSKHPPMQLKRFSSTHWAFAPMTLNKGPFSDVNTDKNLAVYVSGNIGDITITATRELFFAKHVGMLFYIENRDLGRAWEPGKSVTIGEVRRANGNYYKALVNGTTGQNIPAGVDDHFSDGGVDWAFLHSGYGIARINSVAGNNLSCSASALSYIPDLAKGGGYGGSISVASCTAASDGMILGNSPAHGLLIGSYGTCEVVLHLAAPFNSDRVVALRYSVVDAATIKFEYPRNMGGILATVVSFKPPSAAEFTPSYKWAFGSFGDPAIGGPGYPTTGCYYQQRLVLAGTEGEPDSIWLSRTNSYDDFTVTGVLSILDSDTIQRTIGANQVNAVRSLLPLNRLLVFTSGATWAMDSGVQARGLTPGAADLVIQGYTGVSRLPAIGVGATVLYAEDKGKVVHDLNYQFASDNYIGDDLTAKAAHLTAGHSFVEWAFQRSPFSCVWMIRNDGTLIGLTYLKEQQVVAWHHHDTDGEFESVTAISEGDEDAVYVVVKRTINGQTKRFIEKFATRKITNIVDAFCVDCGGTFDGRNETGSNTPWVATLALSGGSLWNDEEEILITATGGTVKPFTGPSDEGDQIVYTSSDGAELRLTITEYLTNLTAHARPSRSVPVADRTATISGWGWARNNFSGADWLEGKTISVLGDGHVYPQQVVTGGAFSLDPPAMIVHFGLGYDCDFEPLPLAPSQLQIRDRVVNIQTLRILVSESSVLKCGSSYDSLYDEGGTRSVDDGWSAPNLRTDLIEIRVSSDWANNATFVSRHSEPTPIGILALFPEVQIGGL
mgnify:FL=1